MNADRRKRLNKLRGDLEEIVSELDEIRGEEREAYDALPESLQGTERGERTYEIIDELDTVFDELENQINVIDLLARGDA